MLEKLKTFDYQKLLKELRDVRMVGLLVFGVVVLLVTWSGISVIQTNYELQKKIANLNQVVEIQKLENSNLRLKNEYYNTDQYLELQARRQFSKAAPGETLLIVPKNVALAHSIETPQTTQTQVAEMIEKPFYQRNFEAWIDFLFRHEGS